MQVIFFSLPAVAISEILP